ncbi:MAG TPA: crotonase/enoyl-CoA hydratase family protein [Acidimicrobiales bacterium]|nr:crotonase/enoyl-CoA hydratase family protein [Acidimicrobiales bacterium]
MTTAPVNSELIGTTFVVAINRPEVRNAVNGTVATALAEAFRTFEANDDAKVAVLAGEGGTFCAGADLKAIGTRDANRVGTDGDGPMGPTRMTLSKPVIAAIDGHAVAGGMELALWCDLRVMEEDAILGVFCRRWGVPLIDGGTVRLPRIIGTGRALDLILTGRAVGSTEALAIGLVNRVVEKGYVRAAALDLAEEIASFPEVCMREDRLSMYEGLGRPESGAMAIEFSHGSTSLRADMREHVDRFVSGEGRHGNFKK